MKDYSSVESKIRKLMTGRLQPGGWEKISETLWVHPIAEIAWGIDTEGNEYCINKAGHKVSVDEDNSTKRKAEVVVGRPDTAKNAFDRRAKLLKQSEIKTKIIDEVKRVLDYMVEKKAVDPKAKDEDEKVDKDEAKIDAKDPKKITGGKTEVDVSPTTDEKISDDSKEKADSATATKKENKKIVKEDAADPAKKKRKKKLKAQYRGPDGKLRTRHFGDTKEETLDEISSKTLDSYKHKALSWVDRNRSITPGRAGAHVHLHKGTEHKHGKRWQGIMRAASKAASNDAKKEEFSQIDEISDKKAGEYFDKGHKSWKTAKDSGDKKTMEKRGKGGSLATKKMLNVNVKVKTTKEDFSPEELAHFEAVMDEAYVDMSKKKCDEFINTKGKPHKVYTATDETRHGIGVDELKRHMGVGDSGSVHKKFMHNLHTAGVRTGWSHSAGKWIAYHGPKI